MNSLSNALPIMVSNYSKLFGVTVRIQGTSAYTNGQVITIPRLDMSDPTKASSYASIFPKINSLKDF